MNCANCESCDTGFDGDTCERARWAATVILARTVAPVLQTRAATHAPPEEAGEKPSATRSHVARNAAAVPRPLTTVPAVDTLEATASTPLVGAATEVLTLDGPLLAALQTAVCEDAPAPLATLAYQVRIGLKLEAGGEPKTKRLCTLATAPDPTTRLGPR